MILPSSDQFQVFLLELWVRFSYRHLSIILSRSAAHLMHTFEMFGRIYCGIVTRNHSWQYVHHALGSKSPEISPFFYSTCREIPQTRSTELRLFHVSFSSIRCPLCACVLGSMDVLIIVPIGGCCAANESYKMKCGMFISIHEGWSFASMIVIAKDARPFPGSSVKVIQSKYGT